MVYLIFFLSGLSALVYQVAWIKMLTVEFGSTVYAVSTVLSVFMTGLALGGYLFGRRADRTDRPLLLYAVMEGAIGVYAIGFLVSIPVVHTVYVGIERALSPSYESFSLIKLVFTFALLIVPTTLMGGTLPVLSRYLGRRGHARGRRLALLYSFNTLGAMVGCLGFAFVWILVLGVTGSIVLSAFVNLLLALASVWLNRQGAEPAADDTPRVRRKQRPRAAERDGREVRVLAAVIAFISGFVILSCEVLWTRLFTTFLSGNALVFATILTAVLAGLAVGGFVASYAVERTRNVAALLGVVQLTGAAALIMLVVFLPRVGELFSWAYSGGGPLRPFVTLFAMLALPCAVMGITFPTLINWFTGRAETVGADVGTLYAVNTVGAVLGSVVSGFVLIDVLGVNVSLVVMAAVYCGASVFLFTARGARLVAGAMVAGCMALLLLPTVREPRYWYNGGFRELKQIPRENTVFFEEGVSASVGVASFGKTRYLTVNGIIVAQTTEHDLWDLLSKAHLPMLIHPNPRNVALVGLGAGVSLGATAKYDVDVLDCIEISPEVVRACPVFDNVNQGCLDDARLNLVVNDGRHYLMTTENSYDVINVDPIDPPVCALYTQDFFQVCHDRLRDGGLMVQWVPVFRLSPDNIKVVMKAFVNVFPNTTLWYNGTAVLLIGSKGTPMQIDAQRFLARARDPRVRESLELISSPDPMMFLSMFVGDVTEFDEIFPERISPNSDDFPTLEYSVLRSREAMVAKEYWTLQLLPKFAGPIGDLLTHRLSPSVDARFARMRAITNSFYAARLLFFEGEKARAQATIQSALKQHEVSEAELVCLKHFYSFTGGG